MLLLAGAVNSLAPHPFHLPIIATSGLVRSALHASKRWPRLDAALRVATLVLQEHDAKVWTPSPTRTVDFEAMAERTAQNQREREEPRQGLLGGRITVEASFLARLFLANGASTMALLCACHMLQVDVFPPPLRA